MGISFCRLPYETAKDMKIIKQIVLCIASVIFGSNSQAQEVSHVEIPMKENFHLFLLVGQSNMAGRGDIEAEDKQIHPRVLMFSKDDTWRPAVDPLHFDIPTAGVGPGK